MVISIIGAKWIGLAGVYVGTVVSGIFANLVRPVIIYRDCFAKSVWYYFRDSLKYIAVILGIVVILIPIKNLVLVHVNFLTFIGMAVIITIIYNMIFLCLFRKTEEFSYLWNLVIGKVRKFRA